MLVLVTYDVSTTSEAGRRRLRRAAAVCLDFGQRVQNSVFECNLNAEQWTRMRIRLLEVIDPKQDSIRFYFLGNDWHRRVEHHGTNPSTDFEGPLIV